MRFTCKRGWKIKIVKSDLLRSGTFLARLDPGETACNLDPFESRTFGRKVVRSGFEIAFNLFEIGANLFFKMLFSNILLIFSYFKKTKDKVALRSRGSVLRFNPSKSPKHELIEF
jgi:hypothetical protein